MEDIDKLIEEMEKERAERSDVIIIKKPQEQKSQQQKPQQKPQKQQKPQQKQQPHLFERFLGKDVVIQSRSGRIVEGRYKGTEQGKFLIIENAKVIGTQYIAEVGVLYLGLNFVEHIHLKEGLKLEERKKEEGDKPE